MKRIIAILFIFSVLLTLANYIWIEKNFSFVPPPWDTAWYIYMGLNDYDALWNDGLFSFVKTFLKQDPAHAPLLPASSVPFFVLFGSDISTAYLVNFLYLFMLFVAVYFITERLSGNKAGMLSVFCVATFPSIIAFSRDFLFEFPLAALTSLSYLFFMRSDSFKNRKDSILFGFFAGLALLTKTMGMIFFVLPFFYGLYVFFKTKEPKLARKNVIISFVITFVVAGLFYIPNFKEIFDYLFRFGFGKGAAHYNLGISSLFSVENWTIYLKCITWRGISSAFTLLFMLSIILYFLSQGKKLSKDYLIIWLWFVFGYILLSLSINKGGDRYALPILPPLAILIAVHINRISLKPLKYVITGLVIAVGILNYGYQTATAHCNYREVFYKNTPVLIPVHITCFMKNEIQVPYNQGWKIMPLLESMENYKPADASRIFVLIGFDHHFLNGCTLRLYEKLGKLKGTLHTDFILVGLANKTLKEDDIEQFMKQSHFIFTKTGFQGPDFGNKDNHIITKFIEKFNLDPLKSFPMSDGSTVFLYPGLALKR